MSNIMELIDAYAESDAIEHQACLYGTQEDFAEAISVKQKARTAVVEAVEKLERDAARYRWCVENNMVLSGGIMQFGWPVAPIGKQWDAYIDRVRAMEATNGQGT